MKILIFSILIFSLFASCTEVKFEEAQPQGIKQVDVIPENIQGQYLIGDQDTLVVRADGFVLTTDKKGEQGFYKLSDLLIVKKWKGNYFINIKEGEDNFWSVIFLTKNKEKKWSIGMLRFNDKNIDKIDELGSITEIRTLTEEDGTIKEYLIKPSRRELKKIINNTSFLELGILNRIE